MFMPQRKDWSGWSRTIEGQDYRSLSSNPRNGSGIVLGHGKGVAVVEKLSPPPQVSLAENIDAGDTGDAEVWSRFREAGLFDVSELRRKDREALVQRITELEKELHDYQYTMGLLLIEKKDWVSKYEEIKQRLAEAEEILNREQARHLIAVSESEKRDENLRKVLAVEKQCAIDVKIQKLIADHNTILDSKKQEFDLEMEKKRKTINAEVRGKLDAAERVENEFKCKLDQILKKDKALDSKMEKMKDKEKDLDMKLEALKMREESIQNDKKHLEKEKFQVGKDTLELVISKNELESLRAAIEAREWQITKEKENHKVIEEEREQYLLLQLKLKHEIDDCSIMKESLIKEGEELRQERQKFERKWELLDERKVALAAELKKVNEEKEMLKNWRHIEEEILKNEKLEARVHIQRELEDLRLKKGAFEKTMVHDRSEALEMIKGEHANIARKLELHKHELEMRVQKKQEEIEKKLQEKENEFNMRRGKEPSSTKSSSTISELKIGNLNLVESWNEREKELTGHRNQLEEDKLAFQKDINTLHILSRNLKDQREEFIKERGRFFALVEQCRICKNCAIIINESGLLGLQPSRGIEDVGNAILPSLADGYCEEHMKYRNTKKTHGETDSQPATSGGRMSWLQKCTRLFSSPGKRADYFTEEQKFILFDGRLGKETSEAEAEDELAASFRVAQDPFDTLRVQSVGGDKESEEAERLDKAGDELEPSFRIVDNSIDILGIQSDHGVREMEAETILPSIIEHNELEEPSPPPENDTQPQPSKQSRRRSSMRGRPKIIKRTRSVKAVVEDAKAILGENFEEIRDGLPTSEAEDSLFILEESQEDSVHANGVALSVGQKRRLSNTSETTSGELDAEDNEVHVRHKKRQTSAYERQTPGCKRYNLRRSTISPTNV